MNGFVHVVKYLEACEETWFSLSYSVYPYQFPLWSKALAKEAEIYTENSNVEEVFCQDKEKVQSGLFPMLN